MKDDPSHHISPDSPEQSLRGTKQRYTLGKHSSGKASVVKGTDSYTVDESS